MVKRFSYKPEAHYVIKREDLDVPDKGVYAFATGNVISVMQEDKWGAFKKKDRWDAPNPLACILQIQINDRGGWRIYYWVTAKCSHTIFLASIKMF